MYYTVSQIHHYIQINTNRLYPKTPALHATLQISIPDQVYVYRASSWAATSSPYRSSDPFKSRMKEQLEQWKRHKQEHCLLGALRHCSIRHRLEQQSWNRSGTQRWRKSCHSSRQLSCSQRDNLLRCCCCSRSRCWSRLDNRRWSCYR